MPRRPRWIARTTATVALVAVIAGGGIAAAPAPSAQASWQGSAQTWISTMNSAIGTAGKLFGLETGPLNIALTFAGPLIGAIFGSGGQEGPGVQDVLDKLQQLDDIENHLKQMDQTLANIQQEVLQVDTHVLMGTCTFQTTTLKTYLGRVKTANNDYQKVLTEIENLRRSGGTDAGILQTRINSFIRFTLGADDQYSMDDSSMAVTIGDIHEQMVSGQGGDGAIKNCGQAYLTTWRANAGAAGSQSGVAANQQGLWLDDRQYYEPLQDLVQYWQTVQSQGTFLLQQAALMQAAKTYITEHGTVTPENASTLCRRAQTAPVAPKTAVICSSALEYSTTVHDRFVAEWREAGVPITDDNVVLNIGTDVSGVIGVDDTVVSAKPVMRSTTSTVWARNPASTAVSWANGTWATNAAPASYDGISGFVPAGSTQWGDLTSTYKSSHPSVTPTVVKPEQKWRGSDAPWNSADVAPFAPIDILGVMNDVKEPQTTVANFATTNVAMVWMPNQKGRWTFPKQSNFLGWGLSDGLNPITSSDVGLPAGHFDGYYAGDGVKVKCFVAPVDGALCQRTPLPTETDADKALQPVLGSWFIAKQTSRWFNDDEGLRFSFGPSYNPNQQVESIEPYDAYVMSKLYCNEDQDGCLYDTTSVSNVPDWLAPLRLADGSTVQGDTTATATLWPVAPLESTSTCAKTDWGAYTRCGSSVDAWLKANIPDPDGDAPVPAATPVVTASATPSAAVCPAPAWTEAPVAETGASVVLSDVTWAGSTPTGAYSSVSPQGQELALGTFAAAARWVGATTPSFSLTCTVSAHYSDNATAVSVSSAKATVTFVNGAYSIRVAGEEPPAATPTPSPSPEPLPSLTGTETSIGPVGSTATAADPGNLAATGSPAETWMVFASIISAIGAAILIGVRIRRRDRSNSIRRRRG